MGRRIFVDIETLPPDKDDCARGAGEEVAGCSEEEFRRLALDGDFGRVLTVGVIVEQDDQIIHRGLLGRERQTMMFHLDEARTLRAFWKLLRNFNSRRDLIIGHNIFDFDLLFLYKRSIIHRVQPSVRLSFARYRSRPIFDTMKEWELWAWRPGIKLGELAEVLQLGMAKTEGMDGGSIYDRFCAGCHQEIADYCIRDVELTREIYYRLTFEKAVVSAMG